MVLPPPATGRPTMGFYREPQPRALDRKGLVAYLTPLLAEEVAFANRTADRFGFDCISPAGHQFVAICSDIVCVHAGCGKVVW
jgi:hypothetical protein